MKLRHFINPLKKLGIDGFGAFVMGTVAGIKANALGRGVEVAHAFGHARAVCIYVCVWLVISVL